MLTRTISHKFLSACRSQFQLVSTKTMSSEEVTPHETICTISRTVLRFARSSSVQNVNREEISWVSTFNVSSWRFSSFNVIGVHRGLSHIIKRQQLGATLQQVNQEGSSVFHVIWHIAATVPRIHLNFLLVFIIIVFSIYLANNFKLMATFIRFEEKEDSGNNWHNDIESRGSKWMRVL